MNIDVLVVNEAMRHIEDFGFIKNMDPFAQHILKTSDRPLCVAMRNWMWKTYFHQKREAEREQKMMNDEFAHEDYSKRAGIRRRAVIHPFYATKAVKDGHPWGDQEFLGYVQKHNPKVFPKRDAR